MKDAYSNLLGEYVQANQVDHDDITGFQIVCPSCREPIFKVLREGEERSTSFFSHYRAVAAINVAECERRVASMSDEERTSKSDKARQQNLAVYRSVIRDAVALLPIGGQPFYEDNSMIAQYMMGELIPAIREMVSEWGPSGKLYDLVHKNDLAIEESGHTNLTPFGMTYRNRIAGDLLRTIFANNAMKSISYMVARGHCGAFRKISGTSTGVNFDFRSRSRKLADNRDLVAEHMKSPNPMRATAYATLDAMLRELHRLPYLKMIENAKAKLSPMYHITIEDYLPDLEDLQPNVNYVPLEGIEVIAKPLDV